MRLSGLKRDVILSYKGIQIVLGHYGLIQGLTIQGVEYLGAILLDPFDIFHEKWRSDLVRWTNDTF